LYIEHTSAFAASKQTAQPAAFGFLDSLTSMLQKPDEKTQLRETLKQEILNECLTKDVDFKEKRQRVEALMEKIAPLSPTPASANSPLLQKNWRLVWTTEKEINFFSDWGISSAISQTIDGPILKNLIEFRRGGYLSVSGILEVPNQTGVRTNFKFDTATLDLGKWGTFQLPPVGEGWFDTIYLDNDMRIDTNSRDDILICTASEG
jgi:hypothetical protein